jgi:hypothetical protein
MFYTGDKKLQGEFSLLITVHDQIYFNWFWHLNIEKIILGIPASEKVF